MFAVSDDPANYNSLNSYVTFLMSLVSPKTRGALYKSTFA
jgi:hypothetical protein